MIDDQIEAYRRAVETRVRTYMSFHHSLADSHPSHIEACNEEEQLRLDGLKSVIGMAIREYAAREPCNPFAINDDVNQPASNEYGTFPPPPKKTQ